MMRSTSTACCRIGVGLALTLISLAEQSSPEARAAALVERGLGLGKERMGEAVPLFRDALELYEQAGDARGEAECRLFLATVEEQRGDLAAAAAHLDQALVRLRSLDDPLGVWLVLLLRSQAEVGTGRCQEAPLTLEEALDTIRRVAEDDRLPGLETLVAYSRQNYCSNAPSMKAIAEAPPFLFRLALGRLEALNLELALDFHRDAGHLETALALAEEALVFERSMILTEDTGALYRQMGEMHLALGQHAQAADRLLQALEAARGAAQWEEEVAILRSLADVEGRRGRFDEALARYREVLEIAELMDAAQIEEETRHDMCEVERASGAVTGCTGAQDP